MKIIITENSGILKTEMGLRALDKGQLAKNRKVSR